MLLLLLTSASPLQFGVDFLENHNGADKPSMAVFLGFGSINETSRDGNLDKCIATMDRLCPGLRASGQTTPEPTGCIACALKLEHKYQAEKACGKGFNDKSWSRNGWAKWYCGINFPESSFQRSPTARYCVQHAAAPPAGPTPAGVAPGTAPKSDVGFAQYTSCNSDYPLSPRTPFCVCWNVHDMLHAFQPRAEIIAACGPNANASQDHQLPWAGGIQCNCSRGSTYLNASSAMANYVGLSPQFLPNDLYSLRNFMADEPYPDKAKIVRHGADHSFPKQSACGFAQELGDGGCTWKAEPGVRMIYGADLLASGWNVSRASPWDFDHVAKRVAAFEGAFGGLEKRIAPRCCGC